jgi:amino acid transporter
LAGVLAKSFFNDHMSIDVPWIVWAFIVAIIIFGANIIGAQASVKLQLGLIVLSILPFLILAVKVVIDGGPSGNSARSFNPSNVAEGGSWFKGMLFAILMFVGFELSAALGEETKNPKRSIPRAVIASIVIVGAFYIITQYTLAVGATEGAPDFAPMAELYLSRFFSIWIELAILLDLIAVGIGFQLAGARGIFNLANDGMLPAALAKQNAKKLPVAGSITILAISAIGILLAFAKYGSDKVDPEGPFVWYNSQVFNSFLIVSVFGGMLIAGVYAVICIGGLKNFATKNPIDLVAAVVGLATCGLGVASQFIEGTAPVGDAKWGRHGAIAFVIAAGVWVAVANRDKIAQVARHTVDHAQTPVEATTR